MSYKLIKEIISGVWAINLQEVNSLAPIVNGILNGNSVSMSDLGSEDEPETVEVKGTQARITIIPVKNIITKYTHCGTMGITAIDAMMKQIDRSGSADAIILDMDTPGGSASYLENLAETMRTMSVPVVTYYSGQLCSAGYYIASNSQAIFASTELDTVGSIGTMSYFEARNPDKTDPEVKTHIVYATKSTQKNESFNEAIKGNYDLMKAELDPYNEAFHKNVLTGRPDLDHSVLNGKTYNSTKAIALGLIDGIKSFEEVIQYTLDLISNPESELKFNFKIKNHTIMNKSYFDKVSAIIGREVTSLDQLTPEEFVTLNESTGSSGGDGKGPVFVNTEDLAATVSAAVKTEMEGFQPAMTSEEIVETIQSTVQTALEKKPAAAGADPGAVDGGGNPSRVEPWEDPNDPLNKYLDEKI